MFLNGSQLLVGDLALYHISYRCTDQRFLVLIQKFYTLLCRIGSLIELSRKELYRKCFSTV